MRVNVVGIEDVSYVNQQGIQITGKRVYYTYPMSANQGEGSKVGTEYVGIQKIHTPFRLAEYDFYFNKSASGKAYLDNYTEV